MLGSSYSTFSTRTASASESATALGVGTKVEGSHLSSSGDVDTNKFRKNG
jgi:hypothetical protein